MTAETPSQPRELDDRWSLPLRGHSVTAIDLGEHVTFTLDSGARITVGDGAYITQGSIRAPDAEARTVREADADVVGRSGGGRGSFSGGIQVGRTACRVEQRLTSDRSDNARARLR
ncbi:MAG TPA: hypothetical protein VHW44_07445 [Pseudonocardiaceae bacterium]|jgi:hypothetical protein|nr:hypothetical protein [Pseudonocardiaceae bacterium]